METIHKINLIFLVVITAILLILDEYNLLEKIGKFLIPIFLGVFYLGQYCARFAKQKK